MRRSTKDDAVDWFGALERSAADARELEAVEAPTREPQPPCLCGSTKPFAFVLTEPVDLTRDDVAAIRNEGGRPCHACQHHIPHGAMCLVRYFGETTTVRDYFHPECVVI